MYPSIARSLQKYLRLTKQTGRHNLQSIYEHLSKCLLYKLSPRVFLEKFVNLNPVWQASETNLFANCTIQDSMFVCPKKQSDGFELNSWSLVCDTLLSRQIDSGKWERRRKKIKFLGTRKRKWSITNSNFFHSIRNLLCFETRTSVFVGNRC